MCDREQLLARLKANVKQQQENGSEDTVRAIANLKGRLMDDHGMSEEEITEELEPPEN